jgi:hypothetical protein
MVNTASCRHLATAISAISPNFSDLTLEAIGDERYARSAKKSTVVWSFKLLKYHRGTEGNPVLSATLMECQERKVNLCQFYTLLTPRF